MSTTSNSPADMTEDGGRTCVTLADWDKGRRFDVLVVRAKHSGSTESRTQGHAGAYRGQYG